MEIIKCENTKEIPSVPLVCFCLSKDETIEEAARTYKSHYKVEPVSAYIWGNYVYFNQPN